MGISVVFLVLYLVKKIVRSFKGGTRKEHKEMYLSWYFHNKHRQNKENCIMLNHRNFTKEES